MEDPRMLAVKLSRRMVLATSLSHSGPASIARQSLIELLSVSFWYCRRVLASKSKCLTKGSREDMKRHPTWPHVPSCSVGICFQDFPRALGQHPSLVWMLWNIGECHNPPTNRASRQKDPTSEPKMRHCAVHGAHP